MPHKGKEHKRKSVTVGQTTVSGPDVGPNRGSNVLKSTIPGRQAKIDKNIPTDLKDPLQVQAEGLEAQRARGQAAIDSSNAKRELQNVKNQEISEQGVIDKAIREEALSEQERSVLSRFFNTTEGTNVEDFGGGIAGGLAPFNVATAPATAVSLTGQTIKATEALGAEQAVIKGIETAEALKLEADITKTLGKKPLGTLKGGKQIISSSFKNFKNAVSSGDMSLVTKGEIGIVASAVGFVGLAAIWLQRAASSISFTFFLQEEAVNSLSIGAFKAAQSGDIEGLQEATDRISEIGDPSAWDKLIDVIPEINSAHEAKQFIQDAQITNDVYKRILADLKSERG